MYNIQSIGFLQVSPYLFPSWLSSLAFLMLFVNSVPLTFTWYLNCWVEQYYCIFPDINICSLTIFEMQILQYLQLSVFTYLEFINHT